MNLLETIFARVPPRSKQTAPTGIHSRCLELSNSFLPVLQHFDRRNERFYFAPREWNRANSRFIPRRTIKTIFETISLENLWNGRWIVVSLKYRFAINAGGNLKHVKRRSTERINDNGTVKVIDKHLERLPSCHGWCMKTERLSNGTKEKFIWNGRDLFNKDRTRCVHRHDKSFPFHLYLSRLASNWRIYTILSCTVHLVRNRFTKRRFPRTSSYLFIRLHQRRISSNLPENNIKRSSS